MCREEKILWWAAAAGCERDRFRVFLPLFYLSKLPPSSCLSCGPVFIGKMLHGSQNWSLNFLFFLQNFDFFCFFLVFFENEQYQRRLNEENQEAVWVVVAYAGEKMES